MLDDRTLYSIASEIGVKGVEKGGKILIIKHRKSILQELEEDLEDDSGGQESQREGINNDT